MPAAEVSNMMAVACVRTSRDSSKVARSMICEQGCDYDEFYDPYDDTRKKSMTEMTMRTGRACKSC